MPMTRDEVAKQKWSAAAGEEVESVVVVAVGLWMGSKITGGLPKRGAKVVLRHCFESKLNSFILNSLLATTNLKR